MTRTIHIYIGNIGASKTTTILKRLESEDLFFVEEPIEEWRSIPYAHKEGTFDILNSFISNLKDNSLLMQCTSYITKLRSLINALESQELDLIVERGTSDNFYMFGKSLFDNNNMTAEELAVNKLWCDAINLIISRIDDCKIIYYNIDTPPEICFERIRTRGREGEEHYTLEYIKTLGKYHTEYIEALVKSGEEVRYIRGY